MNIVVKDYLDKILKSQLKLYKVSAGYIDGICEVVSEQMHSALYHWSEMKNVFITLTEETCIARNRYIRIRDRRGIELKRQG